MYHTIIVVGNVGRDAEQRYTQSGQAVASFSVATNRSYTKSDGSQEKETVWFRVSAWGKQAEACNQYVKKGMLVLVEGRLNADPQTGGPRLWGDPVRASFEITAQTVRFLSSRGETEQDDGDMLPPNDDDPF